MLLKSRTPTSLCRMTLHCQARLQVGPDLSAYRRQAPCAPCQCRRWASPKTTTPRLTFRRCSTISSPNPRRQRRRQQKKLRSRPHRRHRHRRTTAMQRIPGLVTLRIPSPTRASHRCPTPARPGRRIRVPRQSRRRKPPRMQAVQAAILRRAMSTSQRLKASRFSIPIPAPTPSRRKTPTRSPGTRRMQATPPATPRQAMSTSRRLKASRFSIPIPAPTPSRRKTPTRSPGTHPTPKAIAWTASTRTAMYATRTRNSRSRTLK